MRFSSCNCKKTNAILIAAGGSGTYQVDEKITQATTGAVGRVVEWDSTNRILYYVQEKYANYGLDSSGNLTAFSGANVITGANSNAQHTPSTSTSGIQQMVLYLQVDMQTQNSQGILVK